MDGQLGQVGAGLSQRLFQGVERAPRAAAGCIRRHPQLQAQLPHVAACRLEPAGQCGQARQELLLVVSAQGDRQALQQLAAVAQPAEAAGHQRQAVPAGTRGEAKALLSMLQLMS